MNRILKDFIQTDIFKEYQEALDIVYVMIVGSRSFGIVDEKSDYDIAIFVKNTKNEDLFYKYRGLYLIHDDFKQRIHWYIVNEDMFKEKYNRLVFSMSNYNYSNESIIVYDQVEYEKYQKNKLKILKKAYYEEVNDPDSYIFDFKNLEKIEKERYSKHLYRYLTAWYFIKYENLTEEQIEWLKVLKRIRWIPDFEKLYEKELDKTLTEIKDAIQYFKGSWI